MIRRVFTGQSLTRALRSSYRSACPLSVLPVPLVSDGRTVRQDTNAAPAERDRHHGLHIADKPHGAPQWRDQAPQQCRRHLSHEGAITRLIGAILVEQSDEWATQRDRTMTLETIGNVSDNSNISLPAGAA